MSGTFQPPLNTIRERDLFSSREVGLNHPDNQSFIRLKDNGSIEIIAGEHFGLIIDPKTRSFNFFGDTVKFFVKDIRWSKLAFNNKATKYTEPALIEQEVSSLNTIFDGVDLITSNGGG